MLVFVVLFIVRKKIHNNTTQFESSVLNVACLYSKSYENTLIEIPENANKSIQYFWQSIHFNAQHGYVTSNCTRCIGQVSK